MTAQPAFTAQSDRTTVWVHKLDRLVGRFGKMAYEIMSPNSPDQTLEFGRVSSAQTWIAFKTKIAEVHGFEIGDTLTPLRFHKDLGFDFGYEPEDAIFEIPLSSITRFINPFRSNFWGRGRVTKPSVKRCIELGQFEPNFVPDGVRLHVSPGWDSRRVAYFVVNKNPWPIAIECTSPDGTWCIHDGCHRLASAIYRQDKTILVSLGGYVDGWDISFPGRILVEGKS